MLILDAEVMLRYGGSRFIRCPAPSCGAAGLDNPSDYCEEHERLRYWPPRQLRPYPRPRRAEGGTPRSGADDGFLAELVEAMAKPLEEV